MNERSLAYSKQVAATSQSWRSDHPAVAQDNPRIVDSLLHPLAILIRQVLTRAGREELGLILIDDDENIIQAVDAGIEILSLFYSGGDVPSNTLTQKLPANVMVYEVARRTSKKLFENDKTSRSFAIARAPATRGLDSLLEISRDLVALEDLTISGNIGAIIRTSLAFGVGGLVLLNAEPVDIYERRLIRASRGYVFSLPILTATTEEFIRFCEQNRIPILVMAAQAEREIHEVVALPGRLAITLGSEKDGCSEALMNATTLQVQIPTNAEVESLNVSTAAGIMLYNRTWFNIP